MLHHTVIKSTIMFPISAHALISAHPWSGQAGSRGSQLFNGKFLIRNRTIGKVLKSSFLNRLFWAELVRPKKKYCLFPVSRPDMGRSHCT